MHVSGSDSNIIRTYVRLVLEGSRDASAAAAHGLALASVEATPGQWTHVLYDPAAMRAEVDSWVEEFGEERKVYSFIGAQLVGHLRKSAPKFVKGMIRVDDTHRGEAWDAAEVTLSARTEPGYGALMYDIAMSLHDRLMPDRVSVSPSARKRWASYRSDPNVRKLPLDDKKRPKTPSKEDDSGLYPEDDPTSSPLNYAYEAQSRVDVTALTKNHEEAMVWLQEQGVSGKDFARIAKSLFYHVMGQSE